MAKDQYLAGKLAIVTGAGKATGIGAATAYTLASHGANVRNTFLDHICASATSHLKSH